MALTKTKVALPGMNLSTGEEALRIDVFWEQLELYPIEEVEEAFKWARGNLIFFPKPVEILDQIRSNIKYLSGKKMDSTPDWIKEAVKDGWK